MKAYMENSKLVIQDKLKEIEDKENIRIILAVESGSRAWGFESPDSDYDVRFIYVRNHNDYLKLHEYRDVIEWELNDVMDINGWDIKKALRLMYKSNPTLFEWLNSGIVYKANEESEQLRNLSYNYFSEKKVIKHYQHTAKNNYKAYLTKDRVKLKKYFYALRPCLAGLYVMHNHEPAPIEFDVLLEKELDPKYIDLVQEILEKKKITSELGLVEPITELNEYIEKTIQELSEYSDALEDKDVSWDELDSLFLSLIEKKDESL